MGRDLHQSHLLRAAPTSLRASEPIAAQAPDDFDDARPFAEAFGQAAERLHDMPPASPTLDMKLPLLHVADRRHLYRVGVEGQLWHGSRDWFGDRTSDEVQAGSAELRDEKLRTHGAEMQLGGSRQSPAARHRDAQSLDDVRVRD